MSQDRVKLDTKIEREIHRLVQHISESTYDKLQIYARRSNLPIESEVLNTLLQTMKVVITEVEMNSIDSFHRNIKKELDEYTGEENPTVSQAAAGKPTTVSTKQSVTESVTSSKKRKSVTLSI